MNNVIIEIDGYYQQALLTGRACTKEQLKEWYLEAKEVSRGPAELHLVFSRLHDFEVIPYSADVKDDFVVDTDTNRIYAPTY